MKEFWTALRHLRDAIVAFIAAYAIGHNDKLALFCMGLLMLDALPRFLYETTKDLIALRHRLRK